MIEKNIIRIWLGPKPIPEMFEDWWLDFQKIHTDFTFHTLREESESLVPDSIRYIYENAASYAGRSDILRIAAVKEIGGIYIDADFKPLRHMGSLLMDPRPFCGLRSSKSFANGLFGAPKNHPVLLDTLNALPAWYEAHNDRACSVSTGPAFFSSVWFGRKDVRHIPPSAFYPYNGFGAPKRHVRESIFADNSNFPSEMYCAHFGNHKWGGKPKT